jgi:hypothetical protein
MPSRTVTMLRTRLLIFTVLGIVIGAAAFMPLLTSFMIFDTGETKEAWTTFIVIWCVPLVMIVSLVLAWIGYAIGSYNFTRFSLFVAAIPLVLLGLLAAMTGLGMLSDMTTS